VTIEQHVTNDAEGNGRGLIEHRSEQAEKNHKKPFRMDGVFSEM
jgi:hypothetical protein